MEKHADSDNVYDFPVAGSLRIPVCSADRHEEFYFDIYRSSIRLTKATFQNRARQSLVLVRIDIDGQPHRNPDSAEIPCPHIHFYREGFGDKWAEPLPEWISNPANLRLTFQELLDFCHVVTRPTFREELPI
ncbi:MAG: hypothetical protein LBD30_04765 [Verrucomicrobiales bacterium]|nr:hypothetical protein [Verrucomicrobiales bacterium]